jgi:hypothetical protein
MIYGPLEAGGRSIAPPKAGGFSVEPAAGRPAPAAAVEPLQVKKLFRSRYAITSSAQSSMERPSVCSISSGDSGAS